MSNDRHQPPILTARTRRRLTLRLLRRDRTIRLLSIILLMATASVTVAYALAASSSRAAELNAFAVDAGRRYSIEALTPAAQQQLNDLGLPRLTTTDGQLATADAVVPGTVLVGERTDVAQRYGVTSEVRDVPRIDVSRSLAISQAAADALNAKLGDQITVRPKPGDPERRTVTRIYYFPLHPDDVSVALDHSAAIGRGGLTRWVASASEISAAGFPTDRALIRLSGAGDAAQAWSADIKRRQLGFLSFVPLSAAIVSLGLWWASVLLCAQRWRGSALALEAMGLSARDGKRILVSTLGVVAGAGAMLGLLVGAAISHVGAFVLDETLGQRWDRAAIDPVRSVIFAAVMTVLALIVARVVVTQEVRVVAPASVTPRFLLTGLALPLIAGVVLLFSAGEGSSGEDAAGTPLRILTAAACLSAAAAALAVAVGARRRRSRGRALAKAGAGYARALWPAAAITGLLCALAAFGAGFATLVSVGSGPVGGPGARSSLVVSDLSHSAARQVAAVWERPPTVRVGPGVIIATAASPGQQILISTPEYVNCVASNPGIPLLDADVNCPVSEMVTTNPNRLALRSDDSTSGQSTNNKTAQLTADPDYIQAGKVGILILDKKTNIVTATRILKAEPAGSEATQSAGGIIQTGSATAQSLNISPAAPYDVVLNGFTHLAVQDQARLRANIAPYVANAQILEPDAVDATGSTAMSWLLAYAGLALALAILLTSGASLLSSAGPLRSLMLDLGAIRPVRLRLALTAFAPFAVAAVTGCVAGVGLIHVAWPGIDLASTGWNWLLPGIGALAAWAAVVVAFTWGPKPDRA